MPAQSRIFQLLAAKSMDRTQEVLKRASQSWEHTFVTAQPRRLLTRLALSAQNRAPLRPDRWDWLEIREYLVLKFDGTTVRFPVRDGDVAQARLRAALTQRPDDCVVAVTEDAYIRVGSDSVADTSAGLAG